MGALRLFSVWFQLLMVFYAVLSESKPFVVEGNGGMVASAGSEKYVAELYFRKYHCLDDDSKFQNVVAQELSSSSCEALAGNSIWKPKLSFLDRNLIGEGSHRRLSTSVKLEFPPESLSKTHILACEVIVIERLPTGVFADPFELEHLHQRRVFTEASVFGDTNLELPSFLSNRTVVEVHLIVDVNDLSNGLDINLALPLHARYQPLEDSGYSKVEFSAPDLLLRCNTRDQQNAKSCISVLEDDGTRTTLEPVVWSIPSGIKAHAGIISAVTFLSAAVSTLLIVYVSLCSSDVKKSPRF